MLTPEKLRELDCLIACVDVAYSHGDEQDHQQRVEDLRNALDMTTVCALVDATRKPAPAPLPEEVVKRLETLILGQNIDTHTILAALSALQAQLAAKGRECEAWKGQAISNQQDMEMLGRRLFAAESTEAKLARIMEWGEKRGCPACYYGECFKNTRRVRQGEDGCRGYKPPQAWEGE